MSTALEKFDITWERCEMLTSLYEVLEAIRKEKPAIPITHEHSCDLLRAAIVMGIAAMDGYFTDRFTELLVPYIKKKGASPSLVTLLAKAGLDTKAALDMLMMERPFRRVRSIMESYFTDYTTQRTNVIDQLFAAYGLKDFTKNVCGLAKRKRLSTKIENMVSRRHCIAHEADMNSFGRVKKLDYKEVVHQLHDLWLFVHKAEELSAKIR